MDHLGAGLEQHRPAVPTHPPAEVDVLYMQEITFIKTRHRVEILSPHTHAGAGYCRHDDHARRRHLVLPVHLIAPKSRHMATEMAEAHQRAHQSDVAAPGAPLLRAVRVQHPTTDDARRGPVPDRLHQLRHAPGLHEGVRVQEHQHFAGGPSSPQIGAPGEPNIAVPGHQDHPPIAFGETSQPCGLSQGRAVVHHHQFVDAGISQHAGQALGQGLSRHEHHHDHRDPGPGPFPNRRSRMIGDLQCGDAVHYASSAPTIAGDPELLRATSGGRASLASVFAA